MHPKMLVRTCVSCGQFFLFSCSIRNNKNNCKFGRTDHKSTEAKAEEGSRNKTRKGKKGFQKNNRYGALGAPKRRKTVKFDRKKLDQAAGAWYDQVKK